MPSKPKYLPRGWRAGYRPSHVKAVQRPVFGIDVDGTLGHYHAHFLRFAAGWLGREGWAGPPQARSSGQGWGHGEYFGECSLAAYMGVSKATYRRIKLAYRQGGLKRSMPAWPGASELTRSLRARGAEVFICTTRPFLQVAGVEPDTREWLRRNHIQYDGVIAGEHKYRDLAKTVGAAQVVAVLDDLPEMLEQAEGLGITPVMMAAGHNRTDEWCEGKEGRLWTAHWPEGSTLKTLLELLDNWEKEQTWQR